MFKNALISVSDKTGLIDFVRPMVQNGLRIVSTGGTAQALRAAGIAVVDVSEQTHFPEIMGGRVKTLHPHVHMCLLARQDVEEDQKLLAQAKLQAFDLVICNLYPFEATVAKGCSDEEMIENIDIGGPSMLRAAAKNHQRVAVVCDPKDYAWIAKKSELDLSDRRKLAAKVYAHTSAYDSLVAQELGAGWGQELSFAGHRVMDLRYGENPHQHAGWYRMLADKAGLHSAEVLQGKPLSYNNILDLDAAALLVKDLNGGSSAVIAGSSAAIAGSSAAIAGSSAAIAGSSAAVAVKHNNPCGVGCGNDIDQAVALALKADPLSVFGGIIAVNKTLSEKAAAALSELFLECIVAPAFSPEALSILSKKKNLRLLQWPQMLQAKKRADVRSVTGGFLVQSVDDLHGDEREWKFLGATPSPQELADIKLAEKICASLKSNAIAIVKNGQSLGLGMGQVNRVEAVQHAISRMQEHHGQVGETVLASDAFFPFPDSIEKAAAAGIRWILQPGGSMKDEEVFAVAKKLGVNMIVTGNRHFRH